MSEKVDRYRLIDVDGKVITIKNKDGGKPDVDPFHAYISMVMALLNQPFVSSISKGFIIQSSYEYLKSMGYTEDEIEKYKENLLKVVERNMKTNDFMG